MRKFLLLFTLLFVCLGLKAESTPIELIGVNYENGANYSFSELGGAVTFQFNRSVTTEKTSIVLPSGNKIDVASTHGMQSISFYYYCELADQLKSLLKDETLNAGDKFSILLEGIKDEADPTISFGENGSASIELIAPRLPGYFIGVNPPAGSTLNGTYAAGDENAKLTFSFSEPVTCPDPLILYGNVEDGTYGTLTLPVTYSGSTIVADLSGLNLNPEKINGYSSINISLKSIVSTSDGQRIDGNTPGAPGTINIQYNIKKSISDDVYGGFEDADIDNVAAISCYVSAPIAFDGALISYTLGGVATTSTIAASLITVTPEDNGSGVYISVPVSNLSFDAGKVTAELINPVTEDGANAVDIEKGSYTSKGKTAPTECVSINPTPGTLETAPNAYVISFNNTVTVESALFISGETELPLVVGGNVLVDNNKVTITNMRFTPVGKYSFKLQVKDANGYVTYGNIADYVTLAYDIPSNTFACESITPEAGKVTSLKTFTLTFKQLSEYTSVGGFDTSKAINLTNEAGNVVATGSIELVGFNQPLDAIVTLNTEVSETGVYTLTIPEATVFDDMFDDMQEDLGVSYGAKYNPIATFVYAIGDVEPTTGTVSPEAGEYATLPTEIVYTFSRDIASVEAARIIVPRQASTDITSKVTAEGKTLTVNLTNDDIEGKEMLYLSLQVKDITGSYITVGDIEEYVSTIYTKVIPANTYACTNIVPAEGKVTSLKEFTLTFTNPDDETDIIGNFVTEGKVISLKDVTGNDVATGTIATGTKMTDAVITLDQEITTGGVYTLVLPEGIVYNSLFDEYADNYGTAWGAIYNPESTFTFTIEAADPTTCTVSPEAGEYAELPTEIIYTFSRDIASVEAANIIVPRQPRIDISSKTTIAGNTVTINLSADDIDGREMLYLSLQVKDVNGAFVTSGDVEEYISTLYTKTIAADKYICSAITPAEGTVTSLKEFTLTFSNPDDETDIVGGLVERESPIVLKNVSGEDVATGTIAIGTNFTDVVITLDNEVTVTGDYTLVIPEGIVYNSLFDEYADDWGVSFGAIYNPEITKTFKIVPSGVSGILKDVTGTVNVYSTNGVLLRSADASVVLNGLETGIYIINGNKVAINRK